MQYCATHCTEGICCVPTHSPSQTRSPTPLLPTLAPTPLCFPPSSLVFSIAPPKLIKKCPSPLRSPRSIMWWLLIFLASTQEFLIYRSENERERLQGYMLALLYAVFMGAAACFSITPCSSSKQILNLALTDLKVAWTCTRLLSALWRTLSEIAPPISPLPWQLLLLSVRHGI